MFAHNEPQGGTSIPLQRVTSVHRNAQVNSAAASYWFRRRRAPRLDESIVRGVSGAEPAMYRCFVHFERNVEFSVHIFMYHSSRHQAVECLCPVRVPTPPGKSWDCVCKISRTWKVLENKFGPGNLGARAWKVLKFARQRCGCRCQNMRVSTPLFYILQYGCRYHTIYIYG